jgi:hypothetical protein
MFYDIVIERSGSNLPPVHYWTGYSTREYAHAAIGSVGRILIDETSSPCAEYAVESVIAEDGSIPLVRNGEPYATVRIVETRTKRPDTPLWGTLRGRNAHQIMAWLGEEQASTRCGRVIDAVMLRTEPMGREFSEDGPNICNSCLKKGAFRDHVAAVKGEDPARRAVSPSLFPS